MTSYAQRFHASRLNKALSRNHQRKRKFQKNKSSSQALQQLILTQIKLMPEPLELMSQEWLTTWRELISQEEHRESHNEFSSV